MNRINLKAFFSLATFYMHLNINSKSSTSVVCALNVCAYCAHIKFMVFAGLLISALNQTFVSFRYGLKIGSVFSYNNLTVLTKRIMQQGV